jgi:hypothetical protein
MNLRQLVEVLNEWVTQTEIQLVTNHADQFIVASSSKISTTPMPQEINWQIDLAAYAATWLMQQPTKPFEALTTSIYDFLTKA